MIKKIAVAGAGTMGAGIAFSAAQHGIAVTLFDVNDAALAKARIAVDTNLKFLLGKGKITHSIASDIKSLIHFSKNITQCTGEIVVEAIIEDIKAKQDLLLKIAEVNIQTCILASNTSSLSINELQNGLPLPGRIAGIHFFNPAHIMKLVEVIRGANTSEDTIRKLIAFCKQLAKTSVICSDSPGFIVNRVARHFYLESLFLVEEGLASHEEVDEAMEAAGFKMGPFRLMDMIGIDINHAVSTSLYNSFNQAIRFTPSALQKSKLDDGKLGQKTGEGFYQYEPKQ